MKEFEKEGTYVYLWLIYVYARQKPTQYCKAIIPQIKINELKKEIYAGFPNVVYGWSFCAKKRVRYKLKEETKLIAKR